MQIRRTANAGVLLELDGAKILLDGVCGEIKPYLPTPEAERKALLDSPADCVAFTHGHPDHCDVSFIAAYLEKTAGPVLGPADIPYCEAGQRSIGNVTIMPVECRHLGKSDGAMHQAYVIQGSRCVWFTGDGSPATWRKAINLPKPDVIIAPYAYALTSSAWKATCALADKVVLLHLPLRKNDPAGLWPMLDQVVTKDSAVWIPELGSTISL